MTTPNIRQVSADETLRAQIRFQEKAERDQRARLLSAERRGIDKGINKGIDIGKVEVARNLLRLKLPPTLIAEATGLTLAEVQEHMAKLQ